MPGSAFRLELRAATLEDVDLVADLETLRDSAEPRDPLSLRHWWQTADEFERSMRRIDVRGGAAVAYTSGTHELWRTDEGRFGVIRPLLRADVWSVTSYAELVNVAEDWLQSEGAATAVARVRQG